MVDNRNLDSAGINGWLSYWAEIAPEKVAILEIDTQRWISFRELWETVQELREAICGLTTTENCRIAMLIDNSIEHLLVYYGVLSAGMTACTIDAQTTKHHIAGLIERINPLLILTAL